jgi:hypothetical protein
LNALSPPCGASIFHYQASKCPQAMCACPVMGRPQSGGAPGVSEATEIKKIPQMLNQKGAKL